MSQNHEVLAKVAIDAVDERRVQVLAQATASLACAAFEQRDSKSAGLRLALKGDLGAGKTTFVRHFLRALGITGRIKSPSFSVVESYVSPAGLRLHHFDFYRQSDPDAWQGGGLRDLVAEPAITLIEWPEKARGLAPAHILVDIGWSEEALADAPRSLRFCFFDHRDGIALSPHLPQWRHDAQAPAIESRPQP